MAIDSYLIEAYHCGRGYAEDRLRKENYYSETIRKMYQRTYAAEAFKTEYGNEGMQAYFGGSMKKLKFHLDDLTGPFIN